MEARQNGAFALIDAKTVRRLIASDRPACVRIVADAYLAHDAGLTVNPQSVFLRFPDTPTARIIALPAHLRGADAISGIKWIASYPQNRRRQLPRASAVLILNDAETGFPLACLEAAAISACRTAASAVLAADRIRNGSRSIERLGVVGTGFIARNVVRFLLGTGWKIGGIAAYDTEPDAGREFSDWVNGCDGDLQVVTCRTAAETCAGSELVLFATVAAEPHLAKTLVFEPGQTVLHLSLRDLQPETLLAANNVVDDPVHVLSAGTSLALAAALGGGTQFITATVADLLLQRKPLPPQRATIFSPFGLGLLDLAIGRWLYQRCRAQRTCLMLDDFFDVAMVV